MPIKPLLGANLILFFGIVYTCIITIAFLISSVSYLPKINIFIPLDKLIHAIVYLILIFIWAGYYFLKQNRVIVLASLIKILLLCFFYGILIEVIQHVFVPTRQADILDVLANSFGLIIGAYIFWKVKTRIKT